MNESALIVPQTFSRREERNMPAVQPNMTPMQMVAMAVAQGEPIEKLERLMALQERFEASEARKAYNEAFAKFKAEIIVVVKNRTVDAGPLNGKKYAELFSVVNAVTPALSKHGLSASWKLSKDDKDWMEVTCTLKHAMGHSESVSMGGAPDTGGAKSPLQARASTMTYLERYTLKAICGVSEQGDDADGGNGAKMPEGQFADFLASIESAADLKGLQTAYSAAYKAADAAKDKAAQKAFIEAKDARKAALGGKS